MMSDGDSSSDFSGNEIAPKLNDPVGFAVFGVATGESRLGFDLI